MHGPKVNTIQVYQYVPETFAAADIGSNTIHLLIAEIGKKGLTRKINESEWLSLGQSVSHDGVISTQLQEQLIQSLQNFKASAKLAHAESLYVFATEAVRRAKNHKETLKQIKKETGLTIDVVSGEREAELGMKGALLDCRPNQPFLFAETGGGSVQLALCDQSRILAERSLGIGTGILIDKAKLSHPSKMGSVATATSVIESSFSSLIGFDGAHLMIGSGGVARGLWRALHPDGHRILHRKEIDFLAWSVQKLTLAQICARFQVKEKRATTLLPGALIFSSIMNRFDMEWMTVSQFGVREAAILELSQGKVKGCPI